MLSNLFLCKKIVPMQKNSYSSLFSYSVICDILTVFLFYREDWFMIIGESAENYLETILMLVKKLPVVRSVDIATELNYKKSSISVAMKQLHKNGYITVAKQGYIYLTDTGKEIAENIYERHKLLSSWLISL